MRQPYRTTPRQGRKLGRNAAPRPWFLAPSGAEGISAYRAYLHVYREHFRHRLMKPQREEDLLHPALRRPNGRADGRRQVQMHGRSAGQRRYVADLRRETFDVRCKRGHPVGCLSDNNFDGNGVHSIHSHQLSTKDGRPLVF